MLIIDGHVSMGFSPALLATVLIATVHLVQVHQVLRLSSAVVRLVFVNMSINVILVHLSHVHIS